MFWPENDYRYQDKPSCNFSLLNFMTRTEYLARAKTGEIHLSGSTECAEIVTREILSMAMKSADIYSPEFSTEIYDQKICEDLVKRIGANNIRILTSGNHDENREIIGLFEKYDVEIREFRNIGMSLTLVDGESIQFESDIETHKGYFIFGMESKDRTIGKKDNRIFSKMNRDRVEKLQDMFNMMWNKSMIMSDRLEDPVSMAGPVSVTGPVSMASL